VNTIIHVFFIALLLWLLTGAYWNSVHAALGWLLHGASPWVNLDYWSACSGETCKGARTLTFVSYTIFMLPMGGLANLNHDLWICELAGECLPPHSLRSFEVAIVACATVFILVFYAEIDEIFLNHPNPLAHRFGSLLAFAIIFAWTLATYAVIFKLSSVWVDVGIISVELLILFAIPYILRRELNESTRLKLVCYAVARLIILFSQLLSMGIFGINARIDPSHYTHESIEMALTGISGAGTLIAVGLWIVIDIGVAYYDEYRKKKQ
jgi:hypothetical protein